MKATAGLGISAKVDGKTLASGCVAVNWPTVFEALRCKPDFSTLVVDADDDFDLSLRDFDPFPSVSGKHTGDGDNEHLLDDTKDFTKVGFTTGAPTSPTGGNNLQNLTLRNKTTGASCTILTVSPTSSAARSPAARAPATPLTRTSGWTGDEYLVEGNALAWLGYILDNLDKLVEQVDASPRASPTRSCRWSASRPRSSSARSRRSSRRRTSCAARRSARSTALSYAERPRTLLGFDLTQLPRGTKIYCKTITTVDPDRGGVDRAREPRRRQRRHRRYRCGRAWTPSARTPAVASRSPSAIRRRSRSAVPCPLIAISDWQIKVEFTDAAGNHNAEFPTSSPPSSLQELGGQIEDKLGVANVFKLEVLDLPEGRRRAPRKSGTAHRRRHCRQRPRGHGRRLPLRRRRSPRLHRQPLVNKSDKTFCTSPPSPRRR